MPELKTLTIGGQTYDSFVDKEARKALEANGESGSSILYVTMIGDFDFETEHATRVDGFNPDWQTINSAYLSGKTIRARMQDEALSAIMMENVSYLTDAMYFTGLDKEQGKIFSAKIYASGDAEVKWQPLTSDAQGGVVDGEIHIAPDHNFGDPIGFPSGAKVEEIRLFGQSTQAEIPVDATPVAIQSLDGAVVQFNNSFVTVEYPLRSVNDEDGNVIARDEIIATDKSVVLQQRIGRRVLTGTLSWQLAQTGSTFLVFGLDTNTVASGGAKIKKNEKMLCSHFPVYAGLDASALDVYEATNTAKTVNLRFKVPIDFCANLDEWKAWLNANKPELIYVAAEEQEIDITDTQSGQGLVGLAKEYDNLSAGFEGDMSIAYKANLADIIDGVKSDLRTHVAAADQKFEAVSERLAATNEDVSVLAGENIIPTIETGTKTGVTVTHLGNGKYSVSMSDDATLSATIFIHNDTNSLPQNIKRGETYRFGKKFPTGVYMYVTTYNGNTKLSENTVSKTNAKTITIPKNATGMKLYLKFESGGKYNGTDIETEAISANSARYLAEQYHNAGKTPPMITIIDDDGNSDFLTYLMPIVEGHWTGIGKLEDGIKPQPVPIASAVPIASVGKTGTMTWEKIEDCAVKGAEILSHTYNNIGRVEVESNNMTVAEIVYDYRRAQAHLRQHGIVSDGLVFVMDSSNNDDCVTACEQVYKYGFKASSQRINYKGEIDRYGIYRHGGTFYTFEALKHLIDKLVTDQTGWLVFMLHTSYKEHNVTDIVDGELKQLSETSTWAEWTPTLAKAINYAVNEKKIPIVTTEYGVRMYCD